MNPKSDDAPASVTPAEPDRTGGENPERLPPGDYPDFMAYLAERFAIETREARVRLSAWLKAYEPPPRSGVGRRIPDPENLPDELERSA